MQFLRRNANKAFIEVMVEVVSREVRLYGPKAYIDKMEELVEARFAYNCYNAVYCQLPVGRTHRRICTYDVLFWAELPLVRSRA